MTDSTAQTLGSVISIAKGKKHEITDSPSRKAKRLIGIDDLRNDDFIRYTEDGSGTEAISADVLIAWDGANAGTIGYGKNGYIGSTIARLRVKADMQLYTPFLGMYLKSKFDYLRQTATGATIPHINRTALEDIPLPLIEFEDQIRIAHLLGKVEGLIAHRKQHLQQLDDLLKSVFLEMFGDPVRNEKGWDKPYFGAIISGMRNGLSPSKTGTHKGRVYTLSAITGNRFQEICKEDTFSQIHEKYFPVPSDFLLCRGNGNLGLVGKGYFFPGVSKGVIFPDTIIAVSMKADAVNKSFFEALWKTKFIRQQIENNARTTNGAHKINQGVIENIKIIQPPIELQNQFSVIVEKIEITQSRYQQNLYDLESLYGALSQQAFKGELDLSRVALPATAIEAISDNIPIPESAPTPSPRILLQPPASQERSEAIAEWVETYWQELAEGHPFSSADFVEAVNAQGPIWNTEPRGFGPAFPASPWEDQEDEFGPDWVQNEGDPWPPWGENDHEQLKKWIFEALTSGKLKQIVDATTNSITLLRASSAPVAK